MKRRVTRLGSPVEISRLGRFNRGEPRVVDIDEAMVAQLSRGRLWRIRKIRKPKPPAGDSKE